MRLRLHAAALLTLCSATPLAAQDARTFAVTPYAQFYKFGSGYPLDNASLLLLPVAYQQPIGQHFTVDAYSGFAVGTVKAAGNTFRLTGPIDTRLRASWSATPWAVLTLGLNIPTGKATHDTDEAVVASVLSTDLLGFREANFGVGFGATTGIATARRVGEWGVGFGASYRLSSGFEPNADTTLKYTPGNEARARIVFDRTIGGSKLTAGVTFQNYTQDKIAGRNLFQSGNRWRGDMTYSFRTGVGASWTMYVSDLWRERGDLTLSLLNASGGTARDSIARTPSQNLLIGGVAGAWRISPSLMLRPGVDLRLQNRSEPGGTGWVVGGGTEVPLRSGNMEVSPSARVTFGQLEAPTSQMKSLFGAELGLSLRWGAR
jgi:hypothetical protein